jgi:DNA repair protein RadA/Sms
MGTKDVYANLVGGLKVDDPAADLSIICSIASSTMDKPIGDNIILCGEVGLAGEIRSINRLEQRLNEAAALGFKKAIIPKSNLNERIRKIDIQIHAAQSVKDAFKALF